MENPSDAIRGPMGVARVRSQDIRIKSNSPAIGGESAVGGKGGKIGGAFRQIWLHVHRGGVDALVLQ